MKNRILNFFIKKATTFIVNNINGLESKDSSPNIMTTIKEANLEMKKIPKKELSEEIIKAHYENFYNKIKDDFNGDFDFFMDICLKDLMYNFNAGVVF